MIQNEPINDESMNIESRDIENDQLVEIDIDVSTKKVKPNEDYENDDETETMVEEYDTSELDKLYIFPDLQNPSSIMNDVIEQVDPNTNKIKKFIPSGTPTGVDMIKRKNRASGSYYTSMTEDERREVRLNIQRTVIFENGIAVPATDDDEFDPDTFVTTGKIDPSSEKMMRIKYIMPDANNPEHTKLLYLQKKGIVYSIKNPKTGMQHTPVGIKSASEQEDRIPYTVTPVMFNAMLGIKKSNKLYIDKEVIQSGIELYSENIRQILRDSAMIPVLVQTPYILRLFDRSPMPLSINSFVLIPIYFMISKMIGNIFPKTAIAGNVIKGLTKSMDDEGTTIDFVKKIKESDEHKYLEEWKMDDVVTYLINRENIKPIGNKKNSKKKMQQRYSISTGFTDQKIRRWSFYQREKNVKNEYSSFIFNVNQLVKMYAQSMNLPFSDGVDDYLKIAIESVSTNKSFLYDLFALQLNYTSKYISYIETYLLIQSYKIIPVITKKKNVANTSKNTTTTKGSENESIVYVWENLCSTPTLDPSFTLEEFLPTCQKFEGSSVGSNPMHVAIKKSIEILERKTILGEIHNIRELFRSLQGDRAERMGCDRETFIKHADDTPRLYEGDIFSTPTLLELSNNLHFIFFINTEVDSKENMDEINSIYMKNVKDRIEKAKENGRHILLYAGEGKEPFSSSLVQKRKPGE